MDRELVIKLGLDKSKAERAGQEYQANEKKRIQSLLSATELAEAVKTQVIQRENAKRVQAGVAEVEKEKGNRAKSLTYAEIIEAAKTKVVEQQNNRRVEAMTRVLTAEKDRITKTLSETQVAEQAKSRIVEQTNKARVDAIVKAAMTEEERIGRALTDVEVAERAKAAIIDRTNKERIDGAIRAEMTEEQLLTKELTKEQIHFQARDALMRKSNQARVDAEIKTLEKSQQGWKTTNLAITNAGIAVGQFATQMVGLSSAQAAVSAILESFKAAKAAAFDASEMVKKYRESLLELAALKGQLGKTTETLQQELKFRSQTLQTREEATAFQTNVLGSGSASIDRPGQQNLISKDDFDKLMVYGGKLQTTMGGNAASMGKMTGMMPTLIGRRTTAEEAISRQKHILNLFEPGSATYESLTNQFLQQMPTVGNGLFRSPEEMAATLSAFSRRNPEGAGTNVEQFTRATVGSLGRMRGAKIEGAVEKQAEYLKRIGATDQMSPVEIGKRISADFSRQEQIEKKRGREFNSLTYLQQHGYMNMEDIKSLQAFHQMQKTGEWTKVYEPFLAQRPTFASVKKGFDEAEQDPLFRRRKVDVGNEMAQVAVGAGKEETLQTIKRQAFNRLKSRGEVYGEYDDLAKSAWWDSRNFISGHQRKVDLESQKMLDEESKRLGISVPKPTTGDWFRGRGKPGRDQSYAGDDALYGEARRIRGKGGDITPGLGQLSEAADKQLEAAKAFERGMEHFAKAAPRNPVVQARPNVQRR